MHPFMKFYSLIDPYKATALTVVIVYFMECFFYAKEENKVAYI